MLKRSSLLPFLGVLMFFLSACDPPYEGLDTKIMERKAVHSRMYEIGGRKIHYVEREGTGPIIIFIHGTPGSWEAFGAYLADDELAQRARLISVDRPGFGNSRAGGIVTSLSDQARMLSPLLSDGGSNNILLVGHSLGAPVAARMAMDYPESIGGLLLIAPSLDPELEAPRWYNRLASYKVVQWLTPEELKKANDEVLALPGELEAMVPLWSSLTMPVTVLQGMDDKLVDPRNVEFLDTSEVSGLTLVRVEKAGHFILWKQPEYILKELNDLLDLLVFSLNDQKEN